MNQWRIELYHTAQTITLPDIRAVIEWLRDFRSSGREASCPVYYVYDEAGNLQLTHEMGFPNNDLLLHPNDPELFFYSDPTIVPLELTGDEIYTFLGVLPPDRQ